MRKFLGFYNAQDTITWSGRGQERLSQGISNFWWIIFLLLTKGAIIFQIKKSATCRYSVEHSFQRTRWNGKRCLVWCS